MIRISLIYDYHHRAKKGELGPIEVRVTINRKPYYIHTGVRVHEGRLIGNAVHDIEVKGEDGIVRMTEDADILNERLTTIVALVEKEVNKCLEERKPLDIVSIRKKVWDLSPENQNDDEPTLIKWIKAYIATADVADNTKKRYITLCNKLTEFGKITRWEDLTVENIYAWDVWLRSQEVPLTDNQRKSGVEPATIKSDTAYNYHKCLKAAINKAVQLEKITSSPYDRMKGAFKRNKRDVIDYLTEDQIQKVMDITPVPGSQVAMARDLFIFQMFTGLGYADTQIFDINQYREVDGEWRFIGERVKTGVPYVSMLLPPVVDMLKRNGWRVPRINNQRYNQMLKAIGMVIGIEKLHSHMGRHTFATYMLSSGAKIENVSRMLGHTNIIQTQRYAKVLAKDVYDDFESVCEKLKFKNNKK